MVSFASSVRKKIVVFLGWFRFAVKLIFCIAFGLTSSACCLLKNLLLSSYNNFWNRDYRVSNKLCKYLLDQLQSFEYYFYWLITKVSSFDHNIIVVYFYLWKITYRVTCLTSIIFKWKIIFTKRLFTPWKLRSIK